MFIFMNSNHSAVCLRAKDQNLKRYNQSQSREDSESFARCQVSLRLQKDADQSVRFEVTR